jgi:DNA replication protein DnaC
MRLMAAEVCPICDGTGWKIIQRSGLSGAEICSCAVAARPLANRRAAGIPPNYERATLETFQIPQDNPLAKAGLGTVLMQVRSYLREFPAADRPGLLLAGDTGTGKTHLAVSVLKALIERGHEGLFFDYQDLLNRIRAGYDAASGSSDREAYRAALDSEILLLDDLGSHRVTDWVEDTVTAIVTHRCNQRKALIATTNLDLEDTGGIAYATAGGAQVHRKTLADVIGLRARSRLFEMCRVVRMPMVEDYRLKRGR